MTKTELMFWILLFGVCVATFVICVMLLRRKPETPVFNQFLQNGIMTPNEIREEMRYQQMARYVQEDVELTVALYLPGCDHGAVGEEELRDAGGDGGYKVLGPECFTNGDVIAYKGENYYRACDVFVFEDEQGTRSHCVLRANHPGILHEDYHGRTTYQKSDDAPNLVKHAQRELELVGEDEDTIEGYLSVVYAFSQFADSGGMVFACLPVLDKLLRFQNLTDLTNDPDEWIHHGEEVWGAPGGIWQNARNSAAFSEDGGKTYYLVDENKQPGEKPKAVYESKDVAKKNE